MKEVGPKLECSLAKKTLQCQFVRLPSKLWSDRMEMVNLWRKLDVFGPRWVRFLPILSNEQVQILQKFVPTDRFQQFVRPQLLSWVSFRALCECSKTKGSLPTQGPTMAFFAESILSFVESDVNSRASNFRRVVARHWQIAKNFLRFKFSCDQTEERHKLDGQYAKHRLESIPGRIEIVEVQQWTLSDSLLSASRLVTAALAQLVEHLFCNQEVVGSSPMSGSKRGK